MLVWLMVMVAVLLAAPAAWAADWSYHKLEDLHYLEAEEGESASCQWSGALSGRDRTAAMHLHGGDHIGYCEMTWRITLGGGFRVQVQWEPASGGPPHTTLTVYGPNGQSESERRDGYLTIPTITGSVEKTGDNTSRVRLGFAAWVGGSSASELEAVFTGTVSEGASVGYYGRIYYPPNPYGEGPARCYYDDFYACSAPVVDEVEYPVGDEGEPLDLQADFTKPVVVCSVNYDNNSVPVVPRVYESGGSYYVKLQNPSGGSVEEETVYYMVVEEGAWRLPDLRGIEAAQVPSQQTAYSGNWVSDSWLDFEHSYTSPAVLGQVMTCNDSDWSVFWCHGSEVWHPPGGSGCYPGKHVGQDGDTTRENETLGVIVVDSVSNANGDQVYAGVGSDTVQSVTDNPPYAYYPDAADPLAAIVSQVAMDGGDGSWAYLYGTSPFGNGYLNLAVDEDQIGDSERGHTTEQVAYVVFDSP